LVLSDQVAVMNAGHFEQVGTPQELYYQPRTPFVAGFVGANNRIVGRALRIDGGIVELEGASGLSVRARTSDAIALGDAVEVFVRPELVSLGRDRTELPATDQCLAGSVESLLFDGANSAVLVRERQTQDQDALPQTGRYADPRENESVVFGFDPQRDLLRAIEHAT
jgi:spermidine/putrescine transport system ATP-binding protein